MLVKMLRALSLIFLVVPLYQAQDDLMTGKTMTSESDDPVTSHRVKRGFYPRRSRYGWDLWRHTPPFYGYGMVPYVTEKRQSNLNDAIGSEDNYDVTDDQDGYTNMDKRHLGAALNTKYGTWQYVSDLGGGNYGRSRDQKRFLGPALDVRYRKYGSPFYVTSGDDYSMGKRFLGAALNHRYSKVNGYEGSVLDQSKRRYGSTNPHPWQRGGYYDHLYRTALNWANSLLNSRDDGENEARHRQKRDQEAVKSSDEDGYSPFTVEEEPEEKRHMGPALNHAYGTPSGQKRHIGAARNHKYGTTWGGKRHIGAAMNHAYGTMREEKRHMGAAMNHAYGTMREEKRHMGAAMNHAYGTMREEKRHMGAALNHAYGTMREGKRHIGAAMNHAYGTMREEKRHMGPALNHAYATLSEERHATDSVVDDKRHMGAALNHGYAFGKRVDDAEPVVLSHVAGDDVEKRHIGAARNVQYGGYTQQKKSENPSQDDTDSEEESLLELVLRPEEYANQLPTGSAKDGEDNEILDVTDNGEDGTESAGDDSDEGEQSEGGDGIDNGPEVSEGSADMAGPEEKEILEIIRDILKEKDTTGDGEDSPGSKMEGSFTENNLAEQDNTKSESSKDMEDTKRSIHSLARGNKAPFPLTKYAPSHYLKAQPSLTGLKGGYLPKQKALAHLYGFYGGLVRHQLQKFLRTVN